MSLISVSGHLKDVSGANIAGSVVFQLVNYGAAIPRVIGTNALVPTNVTFTAAANGSWSGNIQGNDSIDPGASNTPPTTYYTVQFRDANGAEIQTVAFNFTGGGPANLDSQAPLVTIPSPTTPPNTAALLAATQTFTGSNTFQGTTTINTLVAASPALTGTDSGTETLVNKTLTAPVINGTPTGTGIPTITLKKGTGAGNYSTSSTSYVNVDGTNLVYSVLVPTGWKLLIAASGSSTIATAAATLLVSLLDNLTPATLVESECTVDSVGFFRTWALNYIITGDGATHTVVLQFKTANASDAASVINSSSTNLPTMTFLLTPSN